jgi:hypothetical protein
MAQFQFQSNAVEGDMPDTTPVTKGRHMAAIDKTEMGKANDKGTEQLMVEWAIIDGPCKGRKVRNYITVCCPTSEQAQQIGMRFLKNVCESVGIAGFSDTDELCGRPHQIDVDHESKTPVKVGETAKVFATVKRTYPAGASVATAMDHAAVAATLTTAPSSTATASSQATTMAAKPAPAAPPWARK